jgi:circadian clock protein KaiB
MKNKGEVVQDQEKAFERQMAGQGTDQYLLRLYVTGATPKSLRAIGNIKRVCEEHLKGRYRLEVIDVYQQPVLARGEQIVAAPTLIKYLPAPLRKFIGDMANTDRILLGLDVKHADQAQGAG